MDKVCKDSPESQVEHVTLANVTHVPAVYALQRQWLAWVKDQFANNAEAQGCRRGDLQIIDPANTIRKKGTGSSGLLLRYIRLSRRLSCRARLGVISDRHGKS